ncbi:MGMT family protein [Patescibacteria group bacterium]|nr:MGMT family protein [Patescibacteria group bacterium]
MSIFAEKIYKQLKKIPKGRVTTYGFLARSVDSKAYRAVGLVLSKNPYAPIVPCHRVVRSDGMLGGFMGQSKGESISKKKKMLEAEGIVFEGDRIKDFERVVVR